MTLDKNRVADQFSRVAESYDQYATVQQQMASRLLSQLRPSWRGTLVDLGCGTGQTLAQLDAPGRFRLIGVDLAEGMIQQARCRPIDAEWICADLESTPLPTAVADVVISNAALQWCQPHRACHEIGRLTSPGGHVLLATFGPATLEQFREAWYQVDPNTERVHRFSSADIWTRELSQAGLEIGSVEVTAAPQRFDRIDELLASVRRVGATYAGRRRDSPPLSRTQYQRFRDALRERCRREDGRLELGYECIFVSGRAVG